MLRYGDTDQLPLDQAKALLHALSNLAEEDPYFRDEDWGRRAISGFARTELKDSIVEIIASPNRHIHLSTLLLEALQNSPITKEIVPTLLSIVKDTKSAYVERSDAAAALIRSHADIDWPDILDHLAERTGDKRLALEIVTIAKGEGFDGKKIANIIIDYESRSHDDNGRDDDDPHVSGMTYLLAREIPPKLAGDILDEIVTRFSRANKSPEEYMGYDLSSSVDRLVERALESDTQPSPVQAWSWLVLTRNESNLSSKDAVGEWLANNSDLRRKIQEVAIESSRERDGPWLVIAHDLGAASRGLALTAADAAKLLTEIGTKDRLVDFDIQLWMDLIQ